MQSSSEEADNSRVHDIELKRAVGAEHFKARRYHEAIIEWIAIDRELKESGNRDAKLLSNIAAAQLSINKLVAASMYGAEATDVDPDWWKGYFYRGQALLALVRNKPPSKAMGDRLEQAIASFKACKHCSTVPPSKIPEIDNLIKNANSLGLSMTTVCSQQ
uniref:Uncharacterized protein n=1 Tax=Aureoumbra lagunensis TaxID=44058 RepID=A0A7S3JVZ4_9STRA|mmetsp:Transcript_15961/g.20980  ORF Transcript_15961/g.20980 Transcript_15961/m.20980 type:complete len:161 (-) Transcript_15961:109-591(-)